MTKIGAHISAAGDISLAPARAIADGCECFQFFSRPPQGGNAKPITEAQAKKFISESRTHDLDSYIHAPYYINLASADNRIYHGSISVLREELERGSTLGCLGMMFHPGSAKDLGSEAGLAKVIKGIAEIMNGYTGSCQLLIEISAGAGEIIGDTFEEIALIINAPELKNYPIGVCFDTCHAFASGYDLRSKETVGATFKKFDETIGLKRLGVIHANDSKTELGSHKDRHEHIGDGFITLSGFKAIIGIAKENNINLILETPEDNGKDVKDIRTLKKLRDKKDAPMFKKPRTK
ncbi:MAG: deoxyribonuclease IV [bacterium]